MDPPPSSIEADYIGRFVNDTEANEVRVDEFEWRRLFKDFPELSEYVPLDLNENFDTFNYNLKHDGKINGILEYLQQSFPKGVSLKDAIQGCDFVTNRGALAHVGTIPYSKACIRQIICQKFQDVIFMYQRMSPEDLEKKRNEDSHLTYRGFKFEQYLLSDNNEDPPDTSVPVSTFVSQYGVFKSTIVDPSNGNMMSCFISAEIDGVDQDGKFIELTTRTLKPKSRFPDQSWRTGRGRSFPYPSWYSENMARCWLQSLLVGIERIIFGMKNREGVVTAIRELKIRDAENQRNNWNPLGCLNFLAKRLIEIQKELESHPEGTLVRLDHSLEKNKLVAMVIADDERPDYEFLSNEFIKHFTPPDQTVD